MLARSHLTTTSSPSRRRSPRILEKRNSLPQHGGNFSEKSGECGTSLDVTDKFAGQGVSGGGLRRSPRLNGKVEPVKGPDAPSRTSNDRGGDGSGECCGSGNGKRKSPRLNGNVRPVGVSDVPGGNSNQDDQRGSLGYGTGGRGLRQSPRVNSNVKPDGPPNVPSLNRNQEERGGYGGCGISIVGPRKYPKLNNGSKANRVSKTFVCGRKSRRLNSGSEPSRVSDTFSRDGKRRDRGASGGCNYFDFEVRRSPRSSHFVKPLNLKDGLETTLRNVSVNKVVNGAKQRCGDAMTDTKVNSRKCVLGLTLSSPVDNNKGEHIQYSKRATIKISTSDHSHEEWTPEQLAALQRAYLSAKPTPHFWKKVSKLVPGKSAKECFDKIHSEHLTPPQTRLRSRVPKTDTFTEDHCQLSASKILKSHIPLVKKPIKSKKIQLAHKTIRQLMKKQSSLRQNHEADFFEILELNSCSTPKVTGTLPSNHENLPRARGLLGRFHEEISSGKKKPLSRFHSFTGTDLMSPPVLKQVKNMALHEKYLDHLHNRDAKRRKLEPPGGANKVKVSENVDVVGAAKNSLILDAKNAIKQFQLIAGHDRSLCTEIGDDGFDMKDDDREIDRLSETHRP